MPVEPGDLKPGVVMERIGDGQKAYRLGALFRRSDGGVEVRCSHTDHHSNEDAERCAIRMWQVRFDEKRHREKLPE